MTTTLWAALSDLDLDEDELTEADLLPLTDEDVTLLLSSLDPFQAARPKSGTYPRART